MAAAWRGKLEDTIGKTKIEDLPARFAAIATEIDTGA